MENTGVDLGRAARRCTLRPHSVLDAHGLVALSPLKAGYAALSAIAILAAEAAGQTIRVRVIEATTQRPIPGASAYIADTAGVPSRTSVTTDSGSATLEAPAGHLFIVAIRHIGHTPITMRQAPLKVGEGIELRFTMERFNVTLDTVRVAERRKKPWYANISDGRDIFERHLRDGKGVFIGGAEIEASGLALSEFLSKVPGLTLSNLRPTNGPSFMNQAGQYLTSERGGKCLVIKTDRPYRYGGIDGIDPMTIMGVEVYRDLREVPTEWRNEAWELPNGKLGRGTRTAEPCGYVRVWTTIAW